MHDTELRSGFGVGVNRYGVMIAVTCVVGDEAPEVLIGHGSRSYPETASEVEVRADAEVLHLVLVELPVR